MRIPLLALSVAAAVLLASPAGAHGVPKPDASVRLLQDWNDDCGGDGGALRGNCRGSNDLVALDLIEKADAAGDVVVLRLYMDKGESGTHDVSIMLSAGGGAKTYTLRSTDDSRFTGTGFASVGNAVTINDGTRFYVEGTVRLSDLGGAGTRLSGFQVEAKQDGSVGDFMPGGCNNALGSCVRTSASDDDGGDFTKPDYALRGPTYYASLGNPGAQTVRVGEETIVQLDLKNELRNTAQQLTLTVAGADGVRARFHDPSSPSGEGYSDSYEIGLGGGQQTFAHLALDGERGGSSGTLTLTVGTDKGGRSTVSIPYAVEAGAATTSGPALDATPDPDDKGLPLPAAALVGLALLGAALVARRRA